MSTATNDMGALARTVIHHGDTDLEAFFGHFADDCRFQWGNAKPVVGLGAIQSEAGTALAGVASLEHEIHHVWADGDSAALRASVRYTMQDGQTTETPVITVMRFRDEKLLEYQIYQDLTPLRILQNA